MRTPANQPALALLFALAAASIAAAQNPPIHFQQGADVPPGVVGRQQLERGGPLRGYYQPVELRGPQGSMISVAVAGAFDDPQPAPRKVALLIGAVYRVQVTRIPLAEGREIYPTIELVNRLYPPPGEAERHPVVIEFGQEDLELALQGKYVTRVVYLEDPRTAPAVNDSPKLAQRYFEVASYEDPLKVADELGRPMAIVRIGSRLPDSRGPSDKYLYGSPPLVMLPPGTPAPTAPDASPFPGGGPIAPRPLGTTGPITPPPTVPGALRPQSKWMQYEQQAGRPQNVAPVARTERLPPVESAARDVMPVGHSQPLPPSRPAFNPLRPNVRP